MLNWQDMAATEQRSKYLLAAALLLLEDEERSGEEKGKASEEQNRMPRKRSRTVSVASSLEVVFSSDYMLKPHVSIIFWSLTVLSGCAAPLFSILIIFRLLSACFQTCFCIDCLWQEDLPDFLPWSTIGIWHPHSVSPSVACYIASNFFYEVGQFLMLPSVQLKSVISFFEILILFFLN